MRRFVALLPLLVVPLVFASLAAFQPAAAEGPPIVAPLSAAAALPDNAIVIETGLGADTVLAPRSPLQRALARAAFRTSVRAALARADAAFRVTHSAAAPAGPRVGHLAEPGTRRLPVTDAERSSLRREIRLRALYEPSPPEVVMRTMPALDLT